MQVVEQAADLLLMSQVCSEVCLHLLLVLVHLIHSLMRFLQGKGKKFCNFLRLQWDTQGVSQEVALPTYQQYSHSSGW